MKNLDTINKVEKALMSIHIATVHEDIIVKQTDAFQPSIRIIINIMFMARDGIDAFN